MTQNHSRNPIKYIFFKIYFSAYYVKLRNLKDLLITGSINDFRIAMQSFYSQILQFPFVYFNKYNQIQNQEELLNQISLLPEGEIKKIYQQNLELFLRIENLIKDATAEDIKKAWVDMEFFLDTIYASLNNYTKCFTRYIKYSLILVCVASCIYLAPSLYSYLHERYLEVKENHLFITNPEARYQKGVDDILAIKEALQKYYTDYKNYPKSSGGWDGIISSFGQSKEDWIPGLAPKYISKLPADTRRSLEPGEQYLYKSDGTDYKLISHGPENINYVINKYPQLIDPIRNTWAFGVWTEQAKEW